MEKKWLVIDAHAHFLPREAQEKAKVGSSDFSGLSLTSILYQKAGDIELTLRVMEEAGVDMAVLNQSAWSARGLEICRVINDHYAQIKHKYPGKFILCGHVPLQKGQDVVDEIERSINELGLHGISLISSLPDVTPDSPDLFPLYEKTSKLDVPIVIHPTIRSPLWGGGKKYDMYNTISREYDIIKAAVEILYGVLNHFPDLKFLMPHYGGGMPALKARIRAYYEPEGWDIPQSMKARARTPKELDETGLGKAFDELFDKLYFDMAGSGEGWLPMILSALPTIRADRLCFGTDYPYEVHEGRDVKYFIDNIKNLDIPEKDRRNILGENIKNLFKL